MTSGLMREAATRRQLSARNFSSLRSMNIPRPEGPRLLSLHRGKNLTEKLAISRVVLVDAPSCPGSGRDRPAKATLWSHRRHAASEIGKATCRERVCQNVKI